MPCMPGSQGSGRRPRRAIEAEVIDPVGLSLAERDIVLRLSLLRPPDHICRRNEGSVRQLSHPAGCRPNPDSNLLQ